MSMLVLNSEKLKILHHTEKCGIVNRFIHELHLIATKDNPPCLILYQNNVGPE